MSLPDVSARRITVSWWYYATTDFCSDWSVLPAATAAGTRAAAPAISIYRTGCRKHNKNKRPRQNRWGGFAPIFPDTCYHLTHYWPAAADIPVASDNPVHYADAIRYNARTPLQGSLLPLTRLV